MAECAMYFNRRLLQKPSYHTEHQADYDTEFSLSYVLCVRRGFTVATGYWLRFTSHSTQNRSFRRRSQSQSLGLVWKNKT